MVSQVAKALFLASSVAHLVYSLPGRQALAAGQSLSSSSTTAAPSSSAPFAAKNNIFTAICNTSIDACSIYDVSSSLVTVINGNSLTASVTSSCSGTGCPTSVPSLPTGTGFGPASPTDASSAPFANGTDTSQSLAGPTGTGSVSGTGISSAAVNGTTQVTSKTTLSITAYSASQSWSEWTNGPLGTGRGTGASSGFPASRTGDGPYANGTSNSGTAVGATPTFVESTFVSAGQTFTTEVPSYSRNYTSTATYTFSGTTIEIPIPDTYTNSLPSINAVTTSVPLTTAAPQSSFAEGTSTTSFSKCFTTHPTQASGTTSVTAFNSTPTLICWGYSCVNDDCSDYLSSYPIVAATSTSSANASYANNTAPTETPWVYSGYTDSSIVSATPTITLESNGTAQPGPSDTATRNPDAYTHTGTEPASSSTAVDATTVEFPPWASIIRTVSAFPATTTPSYTYNDHAQGKRTEIEQNRDSQDQKKGKGNKFDLGLEKKAAEIMVMERRMELDD